MVETQQTAHPNLPTNINITYINNAFNSSAETGRKLNVRLLNVLRGPKSKSTSSTSKQQEKPRLPPQTYDDQETQTSCTLSSKPVIQRMQRELVSLRETITKQNEKIAYLERKLGILIAISWFWNHSFLLQTMQQIFCVRNKIPYWHNKE